MTTCKECNKRFRIKLNRKFGIMLKGGYQTTCPYCGYVIYLNEIRQVRCFLRWTGMLLVLMAFYLGLNARLLYAHDLLIVVGVGFIVFVYAMNRLSLWIAGKMYDKLSKRKSEEDSQP